MPKCILTEIKRSLLSLSMSKMKNTIGYYLFTKTPEQYTGIRKLAILSLVISDHRNLFFQFTKNSISIYLGRYSTLTVFVENSTLEYLPIRFSYYYFSKTSITYFSLYKIYYSINDYIWFIFIGKYQVECLFS